MASGIPVTPCPEGRCSLFRRAAWRPRDAMIAVALALLLVTVAAVCALVPQMRTLVAKLDDRSLIALVATSLAVQWGILLGVPLWLLRNRGAAPNPRPRTAGFFAKEFLIAIPLAVGVLIVTAVVALAVRYLLARLAVPTESAGEFWGRFSLGLIIPMMAVAITVAPVVEEIFFRGFLYNTLRTVCPVWLAVILQAGLFGFGHLYEPLGVFVTFAIGLLLAAIYEWRKTLVANILVHAIYNAIAAAAIFAIVWTTAHGPAIGVVCSHEAKAEVVVEQVLPGSPAEKADIRPGDVLAKYDGVEVTDYQQLIGLIRSGSIGDTVTLEIRRGQKRMSKRVMLASPQDFESKAEEAK